MTADHFHLVFSFAHLPGVPVYLHRLAEVSDGTRGTTPVVQPVFDDELKFSQVWTNPEFAVQAREFWRSKGYAVVIRDRQGNGPLFEGRQSEEMLTERPVDHPVRFVALTGGGVDGKGFITRYSPERRMWYCRCIDVPSLQAEHRDLETLWADTPENVVTKLLEVWGIKMAIPFEDPEAVARAEQERQQAEQQKFNAKYAGLRPGDRRQNGNF
jgi:hypothetical protein